MTGRTLRNGQKAADFLLKDISGKVHSKQQLNREGKYILLDFWASWCGPCIEQMPHITQLQNQYSKDLAIISISQDSDSTAFVKAVSKYKMNWTQIYGNENIFVKYGVTALPALYLIAPDGTVVFNTVEENTKNMEKLNTLLTERLTKK